jgi:homoserine dehydrogenase
VTLDLVLVGFGHVARRLVDLLHERRAGLARQAEFDTRVVAIVTRRHGVARAGHGSGRTGRVDARRLAKVVAGGGRVGPVGAGDSAGPTIAFLRDVLREHAAAARQRRLVLVETTTLDIRRGQPAIDHVKAALAAGAHVVTANKGPAAFAYSDLARRAARVSRRFLFEGAVMDGIPIFNLARGTLPGVRITGFRGVVNSTTNFMLTAMEQGRSFDDALAAMQASGTAEADPTLDVDGWDAAAKASALANVLLGAALTPARVTREGIRGVTPERLADARRRGRRVKLVASATSERGQVRARVAPVELDAADLLAGLEGQQNALVLETDLLGEIAIVQRDAGLTQTAYAIVSDLAAIAGDLRAPRGRRRSRDRP